jgi:hypothetical protein
MTFTSIIADRRVVACCAVLVAIACLSLSAAQDALSRSTTIRTPIPPLLDKWREATAGVNGTLQDARRIAEAARPTLTKNDPFTPLMSLTCTERQSKGERVVWEDGTVMALVDTRNRGSKLLVVPKTPNTNFPIDLKDPQLAFVSRVAAATCDALVVAAGKQASTGSPSCDIRISPPNGLGVRQIHVHVEANVGVSAPVDDTFLQRTAAHLRSLIGGGGCL